MASREPFVFRKVLYLVEASGHRAATLDALLRVVTIAEPHAIGYHMHREFLAYKFTRSEYPNDFAYWTARVLGDDVVAERLANLRVFKHRSLAAVQRELAVVLAEHLSRFPASAAKRAPDGREFNLCSARKFVMETGRVARDLPELTGAIAEIESSSLYFHLFDTRYDEARAGRPDDLARFAAESLGLPRLAERLGGFDPYMFSLEQTRRVLLRILAEAETEERA